jgi:hypothetical protein
VYGTMHCATVYASAASYTLIPAPTAVPPGAAETKITTQLLTWPRRNAVSGGWEGGKPSSLATRSGGRNQMRGRGGMGPWLLGRGGGSEQERYEARLVPRWVSLAVSERETRLHGTVSPNPSCANLPPPSPPAPASGPPLPTTPCSDPQKFHRAQQHGLAIARARFDYDTNGRALMGAIGDALQR